METADGEQPTEEHAAPNHEPETAEEHHGTETSGGDPAPESRAQELAEALAERDAELLAHTETEQVLLTRLRDALLASDPEVDPELVSGTTIAELEESFAKAKAVSERLRGIILAPGVERVPAGAPGRTPAGPRTAFEKIREGLRIRS